MIPDGRLMVELRAVYNGTCKDLPRLRSCTSLSSFWRIGAGVHQIPGMRQFVSLS